MDRNSRYTEQELFSRIAEGHEEAFNLFYETLLPDFTAYIFKLVKSEDAVKEVIQESLIRLWLHRDKLAEVQHPRAWFFKVVSNETYRYLRKYGLQKMQELDVEAHAHHDRNHREETALYVSFQETQRIIQQTVNELAPRQRTIYILSREKGLTLPEIALQLGLSRDYVKKVLMNSLRIIRQKLTDKGLLPVIVILFLLK